MTSSQQVLAPPFSTTLDTVQEILGALVATGSVGGVVVNPSLSLNIVNPAPPCTSASRSTTRRTDMDPTGVVYDPVHKLVFAAVNQTNSLQVYSAADAHTVVTIPIPAARQLDITADGSSLLVGSDTRYMSWVDPVALQVVGQVPAVSNLFNGGNAPAPMRFILLASGKVLVGPGAPLEWDPVTNTWTNPTPSGFAPGDAILRRSADHTKVVVAPVLQNTLAVFDSAADSYGPVQNITASAAALNSDGSRLAVIVSSPTIPGGNQITLYDSQFNVLATYQLNADVVPSDLIFSRDDSLRYVLTLGGFAAALHATDLSFAGALPNPGTGGGTSGNTVEWAWAMNAASSVLGSVLAIVIAIHWGLNITLACGAGAYLAAVTLSPVLRPTRVQGLKTVHPESSLTRFTAQWGELEPKAGIGMIFFNHLEIPEHL